MAPAFAVAGFNEEGCTIIFDRISFEARRSDEGRPFSKPKAFCCGMFLFHHFFILSFFIHVFIPSCFYSIIFLFMFLFHNFFIHVFNAIIFLFHHVFIHIFIPSCFYSGFYSIFLFYSCFLFHHVFIPPCILFHHVFIPSCFSFYIFPTLEHRVLNLKKCIYL